MSTLYENSGGNLANSGVAFTPMKYSIASWGDYDNDGDLDLALAGIDGSAVIQTRLWRNDGGSFSDSGAVLAGVRAGGIAWGDYDGDGDIDLALTGIGAAGNVCKIYANGTTTSNTIPLPPTVLTTSVAGTGPYDVTFSWNAGSDTETSADGLSYNLRVGTTSGGDEVASGMARADGWRKLPAVGNVRKRLSWTVKGLAADTYYWSVQAVDPAFSGSPWATQATVTP